MESGVGFLKASIDLSSERDFLIKEKIISEKKSTTLGEGSISGVDINRFRPNSEMRAKIRSELQISTNAIVFLYVGRLNKDKGISELLDSFLKLKKLSNSETHLIIVGPDEEAIVANAAEKIAAAKKYIHILPYCEQPEFYMAASDVLVLPSYREGFGVVIIEAAAVGITSIGSRIYGISDAIVDNKTGLLFNLADPEDLSQKMLLLVTDND
ncbi:MAG: glycosyltransferase, partial [Pseudobdellovibrio sp.]